ncbi:arsenic resistance N-acetyltransferase ArsN2 [Sphingomonas sp. KC8]|uniref:arsenic resistance N-acetyltransferase ArsN2 n=1 Tax=Sphingomonas sp. KC8 TaxID=1030157 RepID=UPI000248B58D|nr:arsenic resistance N-acetyltransferase ArsN2 [Sphingomonas sp. KC8]
MSLRAYRIDQAALGELASALAAEGLPVSDLGEPGRIFFRFEDGALAGYGGIESTGPERLLRSLVVVPGRRGAGLGSAMLAALEREAVELGVERLHLLTTTAAQFFRAHGYTDTARTNAPAPIAASAEFTSLCPASATYLTKNLDSD